MLILYLDYLRGTIRDELASTAQPLNNSKNGVQVPNYFFVFSLRLDQNSYGFKLKR